MPKPKSKPKAKKATAPEEPKRWDVVIYEISTGRVTAIAGRNLREEGSFHTVEKRLETVQERINDQYAVAKVPPGKYQLNGLIQKADL